MSLDLDTASDPTGQARSTGQESQHYQRSPAEGVEREWLQQPARPQRCKPPAWLPVPRDFCRYPPIRGYGGHAGDRLTPREALLFLGLRYAADQAVRELRHAAGMDGGKAAGAAEREQGKMMAAWFKTGKFPEGVERPRKETAREANIRYTYADYGIKLPKGKLRKRETWRDTAIHYAYAVGYANAAKAFVPPPSVTIRISPFNLLEISGLDAHGLDRKHLYAALDRLKRPQIGQWEASGILGYRRVGKTLVIELPVHWPNASAVRFQKLPAPLPFASPTTLALVLFALPFGKPGGRSCVDDDGLCKLLGIDRGLKRRRRIDMVTNAFRLANRWLASLDQFDRARLKNAKLNVPEAIALIERPDGRWRIEWSDKAAAAFYEGQAESAEPSAKTTSADDPPGSDDEFSADNPPGSDDEFSADNPPEPDDNLTGGPYAMGSPQDFSLLMVSRTGGWGANGNPPRPPSEGRDWRRIDGKWREGRWNGFSSRVSFDEQWTDGGHVSFDERRTGRRRDSSWW